MRASVHLRLSDGREARLGHGDLVGRVWNAALYLDDPRISEAHAMVSLRGDALRLLALRGRLAVKDVRHEEVRLEPGLVVHLAPHLHLEVLSVTLPSEALALEAEGLGRRVLHGTCALVSHPRPAIVPPASDGAEALVWQGAEGWRVRVLGEAARPLLPGDRVQVGEAVFTAVEVPLRAGPVTRREALAPPLRLVARYDTVHLHREGSATAALDGMPARLVSELARFGTPVPWGMLAGELWPEPGAEPAVQRKRLDATLSRLRARLADLGVRADLVRATGVGQIELLLYPGDTIEDQT